MEDKIKNFLKKVKTNESTISTLLGGVVIIVVGILIYNYFKTEQISELALELNTETKEEVKSEEKEGGIENMKIEQEAEQEFRPERETNTNKDVVKDKNTHKVKTGENLWEIAEKYYKSGYNWTDIAKENKIINPNFLTVGQELRIPKVASKKINLKLSRTSDENAKESLETKKEKIEGEKYVVGEGDSLWNIAENAYNDGYKWIEIALVNKLKTPDYISVGLELKIPR